VVIIEQGEDAICVGQAAHAWISGQLAHRWGNDRFAKPDPFDEVCLGAEQHDVGMAEWDLEPTLDPATGHPTHFMRMPRGTHLELWSAAPHKMLTQSPYAALLVSMHGHALYARLDAPEPPVRRFLAEQEVLQRDLLGRLDEDPGRARLNQRLVWALDFLSLALLLSWADSVEAPTRQGEPPATLIVEAAGGGPVTVDPWPFDQDAIQVHTSGRHLRGRHRSERALHEALDGAPWMTLSYELVRR
jgi:hypothetical protein